AGTSLCAAGVRGSDIAAVVGAAHGVEARRGPAFGDVVVDVVAAACLARAGGRNQDVTREAVNHAQVAGGQLVDVAGRAELANVRADLLENVQRLAVGSNVLAVGILAQ